MDRYNRTPTVKRAASIEYKVFIAGPIEVAKQTLRQICTEIGLCVTVEPTTYIYRAGEETGYVVSIRNYPRFPASSGQLEQTACDIAHTLIKTTYQGSAMVVGPEKTLWISYRD